MARRHEEEEGENEEEEVEGADTENREDGDVGDQVIIPKKRKEVTTASILENFLLLATSLDDTVREESVVRALGNTFERSNNKDGKNGKGKSKESSSIPPQTRLLVNQLNAQRQSIREKIRESIQDFSLEYDSESARLGEFNTSEFQYDLDEQKNLSSERWNIDHAIEKLRELADELKLDCVDLGRTIRAQEKSLNKVVDEIIEQRARN